MESTFDYTYLIIGGFCILNMAIGAHLGAAKKQENYGALMGFLFGPLGWLLVLAAPSNKPKCPHCKGDVEDGAVKCKNCGSDLAAVNTIKPMNTIKPIQQPMGNDQLFNFSKVPDHFRHKPIQQPVENYHGYEQVQPAPKAQIVFEPEDGLSSLHKAVIIGDKEIVEMLILNGANLNDRDNKNRTPLMIAMSNQNEEIVALLKRHGAKQ